jgi:dTDP-D-glucose 4,6-dehydratase
MCLYNYLDAAQKYFKTKDIFKKSTDAIYIIATKSDLLNCPEDQRLIEAEKFLKNNYASFVNVLKDACKTYKINDNNDLKFIPFSLGRVFFNKICQFNAKTSGQVVTILQQKTAREVKKSVLGKFLNS